MFFLSIDFDGTVVDTDITDYIIQKWARPGWRQWEELWEKGLIGSRECLSRQASLLDVPLDKMLASVDLFSVDLYFSPFVSFLRSQAIPFAVVSDGFHPFIQRILAKEDMGDLPVYANLLNEEKGGIRAVFPWSQPQCPSGTCKCMVAGNLSRGLPVVHIGDGGSDFCIAEKSSYVFSKGKLSGFCSTHGIAHTRFNNFKDMQELIESYLFSSERQKKRIPHDTRT